MDIQYVIDDYSCMAYMMSYLSKPEHEMTEHLKSVVSDVKKRNVNERDEMKLIMQAYSKHREVSSQEAVARTCCLPLKKCTRNIVFVQTDDNALKMSHPMSRLKNMSPEAEEVWMSGVPEKYEEATKILRQLPKIRNLADMSQPTVLLTAFTGTAAFNILGKTLHAIL
ncbi:hypothetical protein JOB18_027468, partial [Solea senegalensis]